MKSSAAAVWLWSKGRDAHRPLVGRLLHQGQTVAGNSPAPVLLLSSSTSFRSFPASEEHPFEIEASQASPLTDTFAAVATSA